MEIQLNGKTAEVADGITVRLLLEHLKLPIQQVAVQVNDNIIRRTRYDSVRLQSGDKVEVLTFTSGG